VYFYTRELTLCLSLFILIWYLEPRVSFRFFRWTYCSPSSSSCRRRRHCHCRCCRHPSRWLGWRHHLQGGLIQVTTVSLESRRTEQRRAFTLHFRLHSCHHCHRAWWLVWCLFWRQLTSSCQCSGSVLIILIGARLSFSVFLSPLWLLPLLPLLLLQLLRLSKLLLCHHLPWILLYLIPQVYLLFLMNFLNGISFAGLTYSNSLGSWVLRCHRSYYW